MNKNRDIIGELQEVSAINNLLFQLSEEFNREVFTVLLADNNVPAIQREKFIDVFSVSYCFLSNEYKEERTDFYLTDYDTLNFHASLE